jgi:hypothetical protein
VRAVAVHPGVIATELARHLTPETLASLRAAQPGQKLEFKTIAQGAATSVWAATAPQLDGLGGLYLEDCGVAVVTDDPAANGGVRSYAVDPEIAEALWALSEGMVGLSAD